MVLLLRTRVEKFIEREVIYDNTHWELLKKKRATANKILKYLSRKGIKGFIFGSVARGDVHKNSDVEIIIPEHSLLSIVDIYLSQGLNVVEKEIIQATPNSALKVLFHLDNLTSVTVPFVPLNKLEFEFYKYGGKIELPSSLDPYKRVPGVDKRLCMIIPTPRGHIEFSIFNRETEVSKILGVSPELIGERKLMLTRRDRIGRTGVYLKIKLSPDEDIMKTLKLLRDTNPIVRRLLRARNVNI